MSKADAMRPAPLGEALRVLAAERPELGIDDKHAGTLCSLDAVATHPDVLDRWLADTATLAKGIDRRTAAAYLMSILVLRLGEILGTLYLEGAAVPAMSAADLYTDLWVAGHGRSRDIGFRFWLQPEGVGQAHDRDTLASSIVAIHGPLVAALHQQTGLSRTALWRLVTDGMTGGFLAWGKLNGNATLARSEAGAIFQDAPLHNRQWRFVEATGQSGASEWFRLRGGCCRLYKSEGGEYCTTCVIRDREDQMQRLAARL